MQKKTSYFFENFESKNMLDNAQTNLKKNYNCI